MANRVRGVLERLLARRRDLAPADGAADADLLRRFAAGRDEAAFELLVWRHGAMVLGVCRRGIRDEQLAEDAFQAVFLVLARQAGAVRGGNVAGWLFRVARRVAARAARKCPPAAEPRDRPAPPAPCPVEAWELAAVLDAEVARLPARLRRAVVLCYLGGRTTEDAARELGCPRGTVLSRLAAARKRLADRLTRRGVTLPAALVVPGVGVGNRLASAAASAAVAFRLGTHPASTATLLASGVCTAMTRVTVLSVLGGAVLAAGFATGVGFVAARGTNPAETTVAVAAPGQQKPAEQKPAEKGDAPAVRLRKLEAGRAELANRIARLEARIEREGPAPENAVDLAVLQSELFALDKNVLAAEAEVDRSKANLAARQKDQDAQRKKPLDEGWFSEWYDKDPELKGLRQKVERAESLVDRLQRTHPADEPVVVAAVKEREAALAAAKARREAIKKEVAGKAEEAREKSYRAYIDEANRFVNDAAQALKDLHAQRRKLAARITAQKLADSKHQQLLEELRTLRQIELELLRQQTLAELGLEGLPVAPARAETDPRVEGELRDLRREVEKSREELVKLRQEMGNLRKK